MGQHSAEMPAKPHKPCNGPNCSRNPSIPVLPVPTVSSPTPSEWGSLCDSLTLVPPGGGFLFADTSSVQPIALVSSIFHPPRYAA